MNWPAWWHHLPLAYGWQRASCLKSRRAKDKISKRGGFRAPDGRSGLGARLGHQNLCEAIHEPICLICCRLLLLPWASTHDAGTRSPLISASSSFWVVGSAPKTFPGTCLHSALPHTLSLPLQTPHIPGNPSLPEVHRILQAGEFLGENLVHISMPKYLSFKEGRPS